MPEAHPNDYDPSPGNLACRIFVGASHARLQGVGNVSNNVHALRDVDTVEDFLNVAATKAVPLFEHLDSEFLLDHDVFIPYRRGEHEFMSHQNSFEAVSTTTPRTSTALVLSHENARSRWSG